MIEAYPLQWPTGWKRTTYRDASRFQTSFSKARDELMNELALMGATQIVLSTNIALRRDGLPYSGMAQPKDPGAAVYFTYKNKQMVFACDRWNKIEENIQALRKTIEAIRGIERWGASSMLERAFTGFQALPPATDQTENNKYWYEILGFNQPPQDQDRVKIAYRELAMRAHPDRGGDANTMARINSAMQDAERYYANN